MCRNMVDIQCAAAEIRRGKKEEDRNHRNKIFYRATINNVADDAQEFVIRC